MRLAIWCVAGCLLTMDGPTASGASSFVVDKELATMLGTTLDDAERVATSIDLAELNVSYKLGKDLEEAREVALKATHRARSTLNGMKSKFTLRDAVQLNSSLAAIPEMLDILRQYIPATDQTASLRKQLGAAQMRFLVADSVMQDRMMRWADEADQLMAACAEETRKSAP